MCLSELYKNRKITVLKFFQNLFYFVVLKQKTCYLKINCLKTSSHLYITYLMKLVLSTDNNTVCKLVNCRCFQPICSNSNNNNNNDRLTAFDPGQPG